MQYDFIVVGAGIVGASVAYELGRSGHVCVIEQEPQPAMHATGRSAALFAPTYGGRAIRAITRASRSFFDRPPTGFCQTALLKARGCLYIARTDQRASLSRMVEDIRTSGGRVELLEREATLEQLPLLRRGYLAQAALDSDAMDIDVDALHRGFLRGARAAGAVLVVNQPVTRAQRRQGLWSIDCGDDRAEAPVLINAAGAWADQVAVACGARAIGLKPLRRTALLVDPPAAADIKSWPAVIDADEQFYFKPEAGRLLLSPADETPDVAGDAQPDEFDIAVCIDRVEAALDIEVSKVSHRWAGLRTFSSDRAPVIGFDPAVEGLFWCAGQGGYGIQTAPALSRCAAALAKHEPLPADVASEGLTAEEISPHRFAEKRSR